MPRVDLVIEGVRSNSMRARQVESMFDVPHQETSLSEWHGDVPIDEKEWNVGLIVGPSGSGKTQTSKTLFGDEHAEWTWDSESVIDDIAADLSLDEVTAVCQAVGFNTVPAWLRPFALLSTGEQFRATMARVLLEDSEHDPIVVDEFTSVVDRQVAAIASHAVQKYVRRNNRRFVAVSCHYDVVDWLQPDWVFEPATMTFKWRSVQPRPAIDVEISRVAYSAWELFASYHYLTPELNHAAACFVLFVNGSPAAFSGVIHRPHAKAKNIKGVSRTVTLPDWQGLGLAFVLNELLGSAYNALGQRLRMYPAHPPYVRSFDRSKNWKMVKRPGVFSPRSLGTGSVPAGGFGGRPNATFEYVGPTMSDPAVAQQLVRIGEKIDWKSE